MENVTISARENNISSNIKAREYSFAKEIRCSFWDNMTGRQIDDKNLNVLEKVFEFIKNDY